MKYLLLAAALFSFGIHRGMPHHSGIRSGKSIPTESGTRLPFYRITRDGSPDTSYLFGTLHLLESSFVDTLPAVRKALDRSNIVIGELVLDSGITGEALAGLFDAPPLDSLLTTAQYHTVSLAVKKYSPVPLMILTHAEPVIIYTMILEGMYGAKYPENQKTGVPMDLYFEREARKRGIPVMAFEQAGDQEQALDSIPLREQTEDLVDLVEHPNATMRQMDTMLTDYRTGHISEILEDPGFGTFSPKEMATLLYNRNRKWMDTLPSILDRHNAFIAVGAGHLAGPQGLVDQLRKRGYDVAWVKTN